MRILISLLLLAALSNAAGAQTVQRIEITEFGIYRSKTTEVVAAPGTATGTEWLVTDIKLVKQTTTVPARLGVEFGFRYKIIGRGGASVRLKKLTLIPQPGIRNPKTGNTSVRSESFLDRKVGTTNYTSYGLDNSWEIVTGTWTIELWDGDRKLASKSFNVVAP
jgi:hypothetical protein